MLVKYDDEAADELYYDRDYLVWACEEADISSMKYANDDLDKSFAKAVGILDGLELADDERRLVNDYETAYNGAQKMIEENSYNSEVLDFIRGTYNKFPTRELAEFAEVNPPETFS